MQQSNTSPNLNTISFGGVLQPLLEMLERQPRQPERLAGQDVIIPGRDDLQTIIAIDSENDIHLLISPSARDDDRITKLELRGLKVAHREWAVAGRPVQSYLDLSCSTGLIPSFRRPFLRFAEDALYEISRPKTEAVDAIYRTGIRWRRFWSPEPAAEFTTEWLRGIFGELLFLEEMTKRFGPAVVYNWTGPLGNDHDFQAGDTLGVEVKTSAELPYQIHCNLRQLDPTIFKKLFIVCYKVNASDTGEAMPDTVARIEDLMKTDETALDVFYARLAAAGYRRDLESKYRETPMEHGKPSAFIVDDSFPKISEASFVRVPDHRISNIRYTLKITGVEELNIEKINTDLAGLQKPPYLGLSHNSIFDIN